ncbi:MAG: YolD-like family protein [bacterium]
MIKDRGNIKWSSLMLTEHRKKLEELYEFDKKDKKPILDQQKLDKMDKVIKQAIHEKASVRIRYYHKNDFEEYCGVIYNYKPLSRELIIICNKNKKNLKIRNIVDISL